MESLKFAVKGKFVDTKIICMNGKVLFHSAYVLSRLSEWFEITLSWNAGKKDQELPYEISLPDVSAEFLNQVFEIEEQSKYEVVVYSRNIICKYVLSHRKLGKLHEKVYELFEFMSKYASEWKENMDIVQIFGLVVEEVVYSHELVSRFLGYLELFEDKLPDFAESIFAKIDKTIYCNLPTKIIDKICKQSLPSLFIIEQILRFGYNLSDLHPEFRKVAIDAVKQESNNGGRGGISIQSYKLLVKKCMEYFTSPETPASKKEETIGSTCDVDCGNGKCEEAHESDYSDDSFERNYIYADSDNDVIADPDDLI